MRPFLVSISCITYNHAPYIRECLDGLLMQKTSFSFEVVIHDDCSTDGTKEIIEAYAKQYPEIIFPMFQQNNQYTVGIRSFMARFNFPRCSGKYIALCEGDDYWTDPLKLQKQIDFLERNPAYSMCFHDATYLYPDQSQKKFSEKYPFLKKKSLFNRQDLLVHQWFIPTASMTFRNFGKVPDYFFKINAGDYNLQLFLSTLGAFHYLPQSMSVYRITNMGLGTTNLNPLYRINDLNIWLSAVQINEKKYFLRRILANYRLLFRRDFKKINNFTLLVHFCKCIRFLIMYVLLIIPSFVLKPQKN